MAEDNASPEYHQPSVAIGDIVYHWKGSDSRAPAAGVVLSVGNNSVRLMVFTPGLSIYQAVPHRDEPNRQRRSSFDGYWAHRPQKQELEDRVAFLERLIEDMLGKPLSK